MDEVDPALVRAIMEVECTPDYQWAEQMAIEIERAMRE